MPQSDYKARAVRKKTREVVEYHRDTERPGKPLHLVIPGGVMGLASLFAIIAVAMKTWGNHEWPVESGIGALVLLVPVYVGSVFLFSYGYELYDTDRALKLTGWIVLLTLGIVVIVGVLFCLIAGGNSKSDSKSNSNKSKSSGGSSQGSSLASLLTPSGSSSRGGMSAPIIDISFPTVVNEVTSTAEPPRPQPVICEFCQAEFIPEEAAFTCPKCGAPSKRSELPAE